MNASEQSEDPETPAPQVSPRDTWLQGWLENFSDQLIEQNKQLNGIRNFVTLTFWLVLLTVLAGGCVTLLSAR